jgi:hypothetical protein
MDLQRLLPDGSSTTIHRSPAIRLPIALSDDGRLAFVEGNQIWQFSSEPGILIRGFTTGGGTIVTDPLGPYLRYTVVQVTARPEPGWVFLGWKGDVDTEAAAVSVIADRHQTLNAAFGIPIASATMNGHGLGSEWSCRPRLGDRHPQTAPNPRRPEPVSRDAHRDEFDIHRLELALDLGLRRPPGHPGTDQREHANRDLHPRTGPERVIRRRGRR